MSKDSTQTQRSSQVLPKSVIDQMTKVSTLLMVWEMLQSNVTGIEEFYDIGIPGFDQDAYQRDVASHVRGRTTMFDASASWLVSKGAISTGDVALLVRIRNHRNEVALNIARYVMDPNFDVDIASLVPARDIIRRLGNFWVQAEEALENGLPVNPERDEVSTLYPQLYDYLLSLAEDSGPNEGNNG